MTEIGEKVEVVLSPVEWSKLFKGHKRRERLRDVLESVFRMALLQEYVHVLFRVRPMEVEAKDGT